MSKKADRGPWLMLAAGLAVAVGVPALTSGRKAPASQGHGDRSHGHAARFGGVIEAVGNYHVEAVQRKGGEFRLYVLGPDAETLWPIQEPGLEGELETPDGAATSVRFLAKPQSGEGAGSASLFVGRAAEIAGSSRLTLILPIEGRRYRARLEFGAKEEGEGGEHAAPVAMPAASASSEKERELYLTPGGAYTEADIVANGWKVASEKFAGFQAEHNMNPAKGDRLCPVTRTKANPKCSWIVGGKEYRFCCPPCVDEFLKKAKASRAPLASPESYLQK